MLQSRGFMHPYFILVQRLTKRVMTMGSEKRATRQWLIADTRRSRVLGDVKSPVHAVSHCPFTHRQGTLSHGWVHGRGSHSPLHRLFPQQLRRSRSVAENLSIFLCQSTLWRILSLSDLVTLDAICPRAEKTIRRLRSGSKSSSTPSPRRLLLLSPKLIRA
jgi:hypothetical protein